MMTTAPPAAAPPRSPSEGRGLPADPAAARPQSVRSLHREVVEAIGGWLVTGRFKEGEALPNELDIAADFNVSRTVVREAVRTLVAKGMLQVRRKTGTVVLPEAEWSIFDPDVLGWRFKQLDTAFVEDLFRFRAGIETFAAELCARNPDFDGAGLAACCDRMEKALAGEGDWFEADLSFHRRLLEGAGNRFVLHLRRMIENLFDALLSPDVLIEENMRATLPRHREVAAAIAAHDPEGARAAMQRLVSEARDDVLRKISSNWDARA